MKLDKKKKKICNTFAAEKNIVNCVTKQSNYFTLTQGQIKFILSF